MVRPNKNCQVEGRVDWPANSASLPTKLFYHVTLVCRLHHSKTIDKFVTDDFDVFGVASDDVKLYSLWNLHWAGGYCRYGSTEGLVNLFHGSSEGGLARTMSEGLLGFVEKDR